MNKLNNNEKFFSIETLALKCNSDSFRLLDQTALPLSETWLEIQSLEQMVESIKSLRVRGAPLIGVSASLYLAFRALNGSTMVELKDMSQKLRESRPTAVNLMTNIDYLMSGADSTDLVIKRAIEIFKMDQQQCEDMSSRGAYFINDGDNIITHCNTGALATAGQGTALGVIKKAHSQGKKIHVYVDETRPLFQGARLTAWELKKEGIPHTLITDSMAGLLMKQGKIQKAFVGCDRIAMNGDFANKIGTYSLAIMCSFHKIPFYVVGPTTTIDSNCSKGDDIPIEQRASSEITDFAQEGMNVRFAPMGVGTYNPSFDVTPAELVTRWIFDNQIWSYETRGKIC